MEPIVNLGFAIFLLLVTLSLALSFLSGPLSLLRRTGVHRALRRFGSGLWRALAALLRLLLRRRRPRVRRGHTRAPTTYFR
jgi:hypothetical protein